MDGHADPPARGPRRHDPLRQLNDRHTGQVLAVARAFTGHGDAISARATSIDDDGVCLLVETAAGTAADARVDFDAPVSGARRRLAFQALARRAAELLGDGPAGGTAL